MADNGVYFVTGATGAQGGSVARHLLRAGKRVRALTRDQKNDNAKSIASQGAELVDGDMGDKASLTKAMQSCTNLFAVTNFFEHFDAELQHGKNLVDAALEAGIENVVFSTKHSANKLTDNTLEIPHLELKSQVEAYAREKFAAAIFVHMNFYYQNFLAWFLPRPGEDGDLTFGFPQGDTPMAAADVEDLGGVVNAIFDRPGDFAGRAVGIVGDDLRGQEYARIMSEATGRTIKYNYIPRDVFASFDFPGAEILANMFEMNRLYIPDSQVDLAECRKLYPEMHSFEAWAANNAGGLVAGADV